MAEYIKIKDKYLNQSIEVGLSKEEKANYKNFTKEYEEYKNLYNLRNHQNITEIRDIIQKYGENAKIHLGGIPMIADDMMSFIKNDIIVFGLGVFTFIVLTLWIFLEFKMGNNAIIRLCFFCNNYDWPIRINRLESYGYFLKFYCINAYT